MIKDIINIITKKLSSSNLGAVYSAFDAAAIHRKGKGIFTVVGISSFESLSPIYSKYTIFIPFKAEAEINITAPENCTMLSLYDYYEESVEPALLELSGLNSSVKSAAIKFDSNIQRLVLTVKISLNGISRSERSGE